MAASARIDELRSKFDDNPRRYFAPLANEYRKAGDWESAIAICRAQLRQFPTHMSGHVVLGQALFEAGELGEAREVFERAVALDPENLIALRHLGDIARQQGQPDVASGWYRRVLDADPYNEQIAATLDELARPAAAPAAAPAPAPVPTPPPSPFDDAVSTIEANPGPVAAAEPAEPQFLDLSTDDLRWAPPEPPSSAPAAAEAEGEPEAFEFVDGWVDADASVGPAGPDADHELALDPAVGLDLPPVADEALDQLAAAERPAEPVGEAAAEPVAAANEAWLVEPEVGLELVTSEAFATETMAELCLEQGHEEEALSIFERLLAQRPGDAALAERVETLRARLRPEHDEDGRSAGEFLRQLADVHTVPQEAPTEPADVPEPEPEAEPPEEPAPVHERDAWAAQAWSDAFGAAAAPDADLVALLDRAQSSRVVPEPEGEAAAEPVSEADSAPEAEPDLSFDRFFAGLEEPAAAVERREAQPAAAPSELAAGEPVESATRPGAPARDAASASAAPTDDEDLAEFNAWLRGLRDS